MTIKSSQIYIRLQRVQNPLQSRLFIDMNVPPRFINMFYVYLKFYTKLFKKEKKIDNTFFLKMMKAEFTTKILPRLIVLSNPQ